MFIAYSVFLNITLEIINSNYTLPTFTLQSFKYLKCYKNIGKLLLKSL